MTYCLVLDGLPLHYYAGQGAYGWGPVSSTTGQPGQLVVWNLRSEAEDWISRRPVFCNGSTVTELPAEGAGAASAFDRLSAAMAEVHETGQVEFQWPPYEPKLRITLEKNGHIVFIWLEIDGKARDIGAGELLKLMESFE